MPSAFFSVSAPAGSRDAGGRIAAQYARGRSRVQTALLTCGVLASLVYVATDIVGGLHCPGYSFQSQAISELAAIGAPSKRLVDALFSVYDLLALLFGIAVFRDGKSNRALRVTGGLLIGWIVAGAGFAVFPMHQRDVTTLATDAPHIVTAVVEVVLMVLAMCFGAVALGRQFRIYSEATLLTLLVSGLALGQYAKLLGAHEPTPGLGSVERINLYVTLLWIAVLAVALLRRMRGENARTQPRGRYE